MILLPMPARPAFLRSFWLVIYVSSGLLIGVLCSLLGPSWFSCGLPMLLAAFTLAIPGLVWPQLGLWPYRAWNRLVRTLAFYVRHLLMGFAYLLVVVPVGLTKSSLLVSRLHSGQSMWVARKTLPCTAYRRQDTIVMDDEPSKDKGWISPFLSWAFRSGNIWACCLLPFLILLAVLQTDEEKAVSIDIYTLF